MKECTYIIYQMLKNMTLLSLLQVYICHSLDSLVKPIFVQLKPAFRVVGPTSNSTIVTKYRIALVQLHGFLCTLLYYSHLAMCA